MAAVQQQQRIDQMGQILGVLQNSLAEVTAELVALKATVAGNTATTTALQQASGATWNGHAARLDALEADLQAVQD